MTERGKGACGRREQGNQVQPGRRTIQANLLRGRVWSQTGLSPYPGSTALCLCVTLSIYRWRIGSLGSLTNLLWWLILCVSFTGLRDAQIAGKMLFLDVPMRSFLEEINICIRKEDDPHQCRWVSSNPLRVWIKQKRQKKEFLCLSWNISTPGSWAYGPRPGLGWITLLVLLLLQLADGRCTIF